MIGDTEMKLIEDEKQVGDGLSQAKEAKISSTTSRMEDDDTEMKQIDDEELVGEGISRGKESKVSSASSRMESVRNGKSFGIFLDLYLPTVNANIS